MNILQSKKKLVVPLQAKMVKRLQIAYDNTLVLLYLNEYKRQYSLYHIDQDGKMFKKYVESTRQNDFVMPTDDRVIILLPTQSEIMMINLREGTKKIIDFAFKDPLTTRSKLLCFCETGNICFIEEYSHSAFCSFDRLHTIIPVCILKR